MDARKDLRKLAELQHMIQSLDKNSNPIDLNEYLLKKKEGIYRPLKTENLNLYLGGVHEKSIDQDEPDRLDRAPDRSLTHGRRPIGKPYPGIS